MDLDKLFDDIRNDKQNYNTVTNNYGKIYAKAMYGIQEKIAVEVTIRDVMFQNIKITVIMLIAAEYGYCFMGALTSTDGALFIMGNPLPVNKVFSSIEEATDHLINVFCLKDVEKV